MTTGATDPRVRRLAQEISGIKQRLNALSLTPQLASSSIEDGAVTAYDRDGQLTMIMGQQHDGTHAPNVVTGPTPDAPAGLTVAGGQMSVTATWDGSWSGGGVAPMDLARIEVHVTDAAVTLPDPGFDSATRVGTIETAAGASLTFAAAQGEAWVWLIARTLPGKASEPSGPAKADVSGAVDPAVFEQLETDLTDAQARLDTTVSDLAQAKTDLNQLDTDLATARTDLDGLGGRLDTARTDLDQARTDLYEPGGKVDVVRSTLTGQINDAQAAATSAAAADATAKADAARVAAEAAAAADAAAKASAAAGAAETAAKAYADAQASAAQAAATTAAAADAQAKADAARAAAESAAAADAAEKAAAAAVAAETAAKAYADAQASGAGDAAVAAAAADASAKAEAARVAAEAAAAADAAAKAEAARAAATAAAATDAQTKADAARAAAEAAAAADATAKANAAQAAATAAAAADAAAKADRLRREVVSRGTDLVTNGTGLLGDNTNFGQWAFDPTDAPTGAAGSFKVPYGQSFYDAACDTTFPVNPANTYRCSVRVRQRNPNVDVPFYARIYFYDATGRLINWQNCVSFEGSTTTLAQPLNNGDTVIHVTDPPTGWHPEAAWYLQYINTYDYVDENGRAWPAYTYTRNNYLDAPGGDYTAGTIASVDVAAKTITLKSPWTGGNKPAGTPISQGQGGDAAHLGIASYLYPPHDWSGLYTATLTGQQTDPVNHPVGKLPFGAAMARFVFLGNWSDNAAGSDMAFAAVSVSDAAAAQATADAAMTTASGKNQILWSTSDAPSTAPGSKSGDVWNKYQVVNNKTSILRTWTSDGTYWKESALTETYLPQVNIGTGTYGELDGLRLKAKSVQANTIVVDGSVGSVLLADGAVTATKVNAQSVAGAVGSFIQLDTSQLTASSANLTSAVVDKLFANIFAAKKITGNEINAQSVASAVGSFIQLDAGQLTVTGSTNLNEAVAQKFFANIFAANKITGNEINAQSVAGAVGDFVQVKAENIQAGFITAGMAFSTGSFVAGQIFGKCAQMNANGFSTLQVAEDGTQYVSTSMGNPGGTDSLAVFNAPNKPPVFEVSTDGVITAQDMVLREDPVIAGTSLLGKQHDLSADAGWLDGMPQGIYGRGNARGVVGGVTISNTEAPVGIVSFQVPPDRLVRITMPFLYYAQAITGGIGYTSCNIYYTTSTSGAPADPTTSSIKWTKAVKEHTVQTGQPVSDLVYGVADINPGGTAPLNVKVLITCAATNCSMAYSLPTDVSFWNLWVEDAGPSVADTFVSRVSGASTPAKKTYTSTWEASWSAGFDGSGNSTSFYTSKGVLGHGYYSAGLGNNRSAVLFSGNAVTGETGVTMASALSGATISKAEIFVQSTHWYASSGGTATFRPLNSNTIGATCPDSYATAQTPAVTKAFSARVQGFWVTVPTSWFSTTKTGILIGPAGNTSQSNYGYFAAHNHTTTAYRPKLRLTYTK